LGERQEGGKEERRKGGKGGGIWDGGRTKGGRKREKVLDNKEVEMGKKFAKKVEKYM
jgi:hypothetical protein